MQKNRTIISRCNVMRALLLITAPCALACWADQTAAGCEQRIASSTRIELPKEVFGPQAGKREEKPLMVTDPAQISKLVAAVTLVKKQPCECERLEKAALFTAKGWVEVLLCSHCFDVAGNDKAAPSHAPTAFYELFQSYFQDKAKP